MKKFSVLLFVIPVLISSAQNIDSLYNEFLRVRGINQNVKTQITGEANLPIKCGFGIVNQVKMNYDKFSVQQKTLLKSVLNRPTTDTSFVSPSKIFRIHFNKANFPDYVPENIRNTLSADQLTIYKKKYLDSLAIAADSTYNYEVGFLNYLPPPKDFLNGGDDRYDIYLISGLGYYGETVPEDSLNPLSSTSYIIMDNAFGTGFYTHRINAAKVTIAHEFHHAIQLGHYGFWPKDLFYHELTSTSMEEFVYDNINDYYQYLDTYFRNPQRAFSSNDGYDLAIWNIFLKDRFGANIIKLTWELMPVERALNAIDKAIQQQQTGSDFKTEFNKFGQWTYFTGGRSILNKYFKEAANYPLINPTEITNSITVSSEAVSNNFYKMYSNSNGGKDSVITLITNSDIAGGISSPVSTLSFIYTLSTSSITGGKKIAENFYSKLEPPSNSLTEANVLSGNVMFTVIDYPFPQPFKYSLYNVINFPVAANGEKTAQLYIYSVDMNLVYSGLINIVGNQIISWNCLDNNSKKLGTGVYIFVTKTGDTIKKGKFVIHND
ncbi:MAG: hypothetical protein NTZ27_08425 [Ignavibacteriales bacterium]|nr:hypothetical protein [Ignavibacteriales bacterium]